MCLDVTLYVNVCVCGVSVCVCECVCVGCKCVCMWMCVCAVSVCAYVNVCVLGVSVCVCECVCVGCQCVRMWMCVCWSEVCVYVNVFGCHVYEWVMSHIWMSHVTHMNESCHTYEWVMSHNQYGTGNETTAYLQMMCVCWSEVCVYVNVFGCHNETSGFSSCFAVYGMCSCKSIRLFCKRALQKSLYSVKRPIIFYVWERAQHLKVCRSCFFFSWDDIVSNFLRVRWVCVLMCVSVDVHVETSGFFLVQLFYGTGPTVEGVHMFFSLSVCVGCVCWCVCVCVCVCVEVHFETSGF